MVKKQRQCGSITKSILQNISNFTATFFTNYFLQFVPFNYSAVGSGFSFTYIVLSFYINSIAF